MEEIEVKHKAPSFIIASTIDADLCDILIKEFESNSNQSNFDELRGYHRLNNSKVDPILMERYLSEVNKVFKLYKDKYEWCSNSTTTKWSVMSPFNLQKYEPGFSYNPIHIEDGGPREGKLIRNLTFTTYLNDIEEGGETEFIYQGVKVQPKKGLTVIFPAGWTHPHRGIPAHNETKYIITGWASYHHRC